MDTKILHYAATSAQCRAARAFLKWTQEELAQRARVARKTVADFESGRRPIRRTRREITTAFEAAGMVFLTDPGEGVRREPPAAAPAGPKTRP